VSPAALIKCGNASLLPTENIGQLFGRTAKSRHTNAEGRAVRDLH
jgi:hypothetical protein